jgi:hypothetical protein
MEYTIPDIGDPFVTFGPGGVAIEVRVVWNDPAETGDPFEFPRGEVTLVRWKEGTLTKEAQYTRPMPSFEALMTDLADYGVHPAWFQFVSRSVFDQFRGISLSAAYGLALEKHQHSR